MNKSIAKFALPLFLVWPFGAFILSFFNFKSKSSAIVFILFSALFGYAFSFLDASADSFRIALVFNNFNFSTLQNIYEMYKAGGTPDLYRFLIYGITKLVTNNPKVLFAIFGFVFGIFCYGSLRMLVIEKENYRGFYFVILFVVFFALNPISNINGVRFWTATWVFFFSVTNFLFFKKMGWIFGIISTPLIHFSFLFPIVIIVLFYFSQRLIYSERKIFTWVFFMFIISFLFSWFISTNTIKLGFISDSEVLSSSISDKIDTYNSDRITNVMNDRSGSLFHTVARFFSYANRIYIFLFLLLIKSKVQKMNHANELNKFLSFIFIFLSLGFIASTIPSGGRFLQVGYLFVLFFLVRLYKLHPSLMMKRLILGLIPLFSFQVLFTIVYLSITVVSKTLWYGNLLWIVGEGIGYKYI